MQVCYHTCQLLNRTCQLLNRTWQLQIILGVPLGNHTFHAQFNKIVVRYCSSSHINQAQSVRGVILLLQSAVGGVFLLLLPRMYSMPLPAVRWYILVVTSSSGCCVLIATAQVCILCHSQHCVFLLSPPSGVFLLLLPAVGGGSSDKFLQSSKALFQCPLDLCVKTNCLDKSKC